MKNNLYYDHILKLMNKEIEKQVVHEIPEELEEIKICSAKGFSCNRMAFNNKYIKKVKNPENADYILFSGEIENVAARGYNSWRCMYYSFKKDAIDYDCDLLSVSMPKCYIPKKQTLEFVDNYKNYINKKLITNEILLSWLNTKDKHELNIETICNLLKSSDTNNIKTGLMLANKINLEKYKYEICKALFENKNSAECILLNSSLRQNSHGKFLYDYFKLNKITYDCRINFYEFAIRNLNFFKDNTDDIIKGFQDIINKDVKSYIDRRIRYYNDIKINIDYKISNNINDMTICNE